MELVYSEYWLMKRRKREDILETHIEYALTHSDVIKDRQHEDRLNAIIRVPPSGRTLKVVYKRISKDKILVITAYWLD